MFFDKELWENCKNAIEMNRSNCMKILQDNQSVKFGQQYSFSDIKTIDEYRKRVPLSDYSTYSEYIEAMLRGEENQLTVYKVFGYCHTSATEGNSKYIPLTEEELVRYSNYFERYQDDELKKIGGMRLFINCFRTLPGSKIEAPSLFSELYYKYLMEQGYLDMNTYVGGSSLLFETQPGDILFAKVWAAFLTEEISIIESIFLYDQLIFFGYMEENYREILNSIRRQEIPDRISLSDSVKQTLLSMPVSEKRLKTVEKELDMGFQNIARRLWPRLRMLSGISNKSFFSEDTALKRYAEDVPRYYLTYTASECSMGFPFGENDFRYVLMPNNAFYEFLPYESDSEETVLHHELEEGSMYEIVITNFAGLYRYRMGDIIKVTGFYEQSPVIEFAFRRNQVLNIAGEKMTARQLEQAVEAISSNGIWLEQYCFGASIEQIPGKYIAAVVLGEPTRKVTPEDLSSILDRLLQEQNADYRDLRNMNHLGMLEAAVFDRDTYYRFLKENGLSEGHNKPKHIMLKEGI